MLDVETFLKNSIISRNGGGQDRCETTTPAILKSKQAQFTVDDNKELTTPPPIPPTPQNAKTNFTVNNIPTDPTTSSPNLDFLPSCSSHVFLIPEETHGFHEDPLLFSVEHDLLQPITSPFMVPGIYKKLDTLPAGSLSSPSSAASATCEARNVYISEREPHGRIVGANEFHDLYACAKDASEMTGYLRKVNPRGGGLHLDHTQSRITNSNREANNSMGNNWSEIEKPLDDLTKLAYDILKLSQQDQIVIDRKRNEIIRTENGSNQKTIYRYLTPEALGLRPPTRDEKSSVPNSEPIKLKFKLGRPRKRFAEEKCNQPPRKIRVQQKRKEAERKIDNNPPLKPTTTTTTLAAVTPKPPELRTRSGRIVKLVQPTPVTAGLEADAVDDEPPEASAALMRNFLAELRDSDFRYHKPISPMALSCPASPPLREDIPPVPIATSSPSKRRIPPESICPTCNKIFLGRRLQRHFTKHPDHMRVGEMATSHQPPLPPNQNNTNAHELEAPLEDMTLFRFLAAKLQRSQLNEDQRADLFLHEIDDLVTQLQLRSSRLIRNTSGLHFVSSRTARVLGIPEGQYALDMAAIDAAPPEPDPMPETACLLNFAQHMHHSTAARSAPPSTVNTRSLDYTALSMSLDDTLTDEAAQKLNLSAGGKLLPPSEESLLRAVDDLVHEGMKKLAGTNLLHPPEGSGGVSASVPHYDHASDNAVEAVSMKETNVNQQATPLLDLAVDFFQFNN